jgi:hypothetical protein
MALLPREEVKKRVPADSLEMKTCVTNFELPSFVFSLAF